MTAPPSSHPAHVPQERHLAALQLALIVAYADEQLCEEEQVMLGKQAMALCQTAEDVRGLRSFIDSLPSQVASKDWVKRALNDVSQALTESNEVHEAFAMALEMAAADGKIQMRETAALLEIADHLGVDAEFARARLRRVRKTSKENLPDLDKTPWEPDGRPSHQSED